MLSFKEEILAGIPAELPEVKPYDPEINHAPKRKDILKDEEKVVLTGPGPAFIPRLNDVYRRVIYLRSAEEGILSGIPKKLEPMVNDLYETCGVEVTYDLDPLHII